MELRLELISIPVTDVDRAIAFYVDQVGFSLDHDHRVSDTLRFVQLTPPGSACSIQLDTSADAAAPGSVRGMQVVVRSAEATRAWFATRGLDVGEVQDFPWGRFLFFADPDGNTWAVQEPPDWSAAGF